MRKLLVGLIVVTIMAFVGITGVGSVCWAGTEDEIAITGTYESESGSGIDTRGTYPKWYVEYVAVIEKVSGGVRITCGAYRFSGSRSEYAVLAAQAMAAGEPAYFYLTSATRWSHMALILP